MRHLACFPFKNRGTLVKNVSLHMKERDTDGTKRSCYVMSDIKIGHSMQQQSICIERVEWEQVKVDSKCGKERSILHILNEKHARR